MAERNEAPVRPTPVDDGLGTPEGPLVVGVPALNREEYFFCTIDEVQRDLHQKLMEAERRHGTTYPEHVYLKRDKAGQVYEVVGGAETPLNVFGAPWSGIRTESNLVLDGRRLSTRGGAKGNIWGLGEQGPIDSAPPLRPAKVGSTMAGLYSNPEHGDSKGIRSCVQKGTQVFRENPSQFLQGVRGCTNFYDAPPNHNVPRYPTQPNQEQDALLARANEQGDTRCADDKVQENNPFKDSDDSSENDKIEDLGTTMNTATTSKKRQGKLAITADGEDPSSSVRGQQEERVEIPSSSSDVPSFSTPSPSSSSSSPSTRSTTKGSSEGALRELLDACEEDIEEYSTQDDDSKDAAAMQQAKASVSDLRQVPTPSKHAGLKLVSNPGILAIKNLSLTDTQTEQRSLAGETRCSTSNTTEPTNPHLTAINAIRNNTYITVPTTSVPQTLQFISRKGDNIGKLICVEKGKRSVGSTRPRRQTRLVPDTSKDEALKKELNSRSWGLTSSDDEGSTPRDIVEPDDTPPFTDSPSTVDSTPTSKRPRSTDTTTSATDNKNAGCKRARFGTQDDSDPATPSFIKRHFDREQRRLQKLNAQRKTGGPVLKGAGYTARLPSRRSSKKHDWDNPNGFSKGFTTGPDAWFNKTDECSKANAESTPKQQMCLETCSSSEKVPARRSSKKLDRDYPNEFSKGFTTGPDAWFKKTDDCAKGTAESASKRQRLLETSSSSSSEDEYAPYAKGTSKRRSPRDQPSRPGGTYFGPRRSRPIRRSDKSGMFLGYHQSVNVAATGVCYAQVPYWETNFRGAAATCLIQTYDVYTWYLFWMAEMRFIMWQSDDVLMSFVERYNSWSTHATRICW